MNLKSKLIFYLQFCNIFGYILRQSRQIEWPTIDHCWSALTFSRTLIYRIAYRCDFKFWFFQSTYASQKSFWCRVTFQIFAYKWADRFANKTSRRWAKNATTFYRLCAKIFVKPAKITVTHEWITSEMAKNK